MSSVTPESKQPSKAIPNTSGANLSDSKSRWATETLGGFHTNALQVRERINGSTPSSSYPRLPRQTPSQPEESESPSQPSLPDAGINSQSLALFFNAPLYKSSPSEQPSQPTQQNIYVEETPPKPYSLSVASLISPDSLPLFMRNDMPPAILSATTNSAPAATNAPQQQEKQIAEPPLTPSGKIPLQSDLNLPPTSTVSTITATDRIAAFYTPHPPNYSQPFPALPEVLNRPFLHPSTQSPEMREREWIESFQTRELPKLPAIEPQPKRRNRLVEKAKDVFFIGLRIAYSPISAISYQRALRRLTPEEQKILKQFPHANLPKPRQPDPSSPLYTANPIPRYEHPDKTSHQVEPPERVSPIDKKLAALSQLLQHVSFFQESKTHPGRFTGQMAIEEAGRVSLELSETDDIICTARLPDGSIIDVLLVNPADKTYPDTSPRQTAGIRNQRQREAAFSVSPTQKQIERIQSIASHIARLSIKDSPGATSEGQELLQRIFLTALGNVENEDFPVTAPARLESRDNSWLEIETDMTRRADDTRHVFDAHFALEPTGLSIDSFLTDPVIPNIDQNFFFTISSQNGITITTASDAVRNMFPNSYAAAKERALQLLSALTYRIRPDKHNAFASSNPLDTLDDVIYILQRFILAYTSAGERNLVSLV